MNDSDFDDLLRTARADLPLPDSFKQEVWHRIESVEFESPRVVVWFHDFAAGLARPWGATASIAATVALGLWLGSVSISDPQSAKVAYERSITPFSNANLK
ncbi:MAG TPA: hypothetical protein VF258_10865 [Luteolibacter sp.]